MLIEVPIRNVEGPEITTLTYRDPNMGIMFAFKFRIDGVTLAEVKLTTREAMRLFEVLDDFLRTYPECF